MSIALTGAESSAEYQFLKKKFTLLEGDRKAYYETASKTIIDNRENIYALQAENTELLTKIKSINQIVPEKYFDESNVGCAETKMFDRMYLLRKKLDDIRCSKREKLSNIAKLADEYRFAVKDATYLEKTKSIVKASENDMAIRKIYNKKEKTDMQMAESINVRRTYEKLIEHFQEISRQFGSKTQELDKMLKISGLELENLNEMGVDAAVARDKALQELHDLEEMTVSARKAHEASLNEIKDELQRSSFKVEEQKRMEESAKRKKSAEIDRPSKLERAPSGLVMETGLELEKLERMAKIKEAIGTSEKSSVDDILSKLEIQRGTTKNLEVLKDDYYDQIEKLKHELASLIQSYEKEKMSGPTDEATFLKNTVGEISEKQEQVEAQVTEIKEETYKLTDLLFKAKTGALHLIEKLHFHAMSENSKVEELDPALSSNSVLFMAIVEKKLTTVLEETEQLNARAELADQEEQSQPKEGSGKAKKVEGEQLHLPEYNVRIVLDNKAASTDKDTYENEGDDEVYLTRETIKKRSQLLVDSKKKKGYGKARRSRKRF